METGTDYTVQWESHDTPGRWHSLSTYPSLDMAREQIDSLDAEDRRLGSLPTTWRIKVSCWNTLCYWPGL